MVLNVYYKEKISKVTKEKINTAETETKIELKPIEELEEKKFFIPDYQRGYRWEEQQVNDLLNDLDEFKESITQSDNKKIYCLQPLVVKKENIENEEYYSVIDGQQRLTTIKILLACLNGDKTYSIKYQTRERSEDFLDKIKERDVEESKENADFFHMYYAKETINKWLKNKTNDYKIDLKTKIEEKVNFIWYELGEQEDPIKIFTRLNIGKIGLTESELIKALFLSSSNFTSNNSEGTKLLTLVEIANEWDKFEYRLQDDRFWLFFHNPVYSKPTRIDYILDMARKIYDGEGQNDGEMYPTFKYFYNNFQSAENKQEYLTDQWREICKIYQIIEEWYNDEELYHYIGYLSSLKKDDSVIEYIKAYLSGKEYKTGKKTIKTKVDFVEYLKYEIKSLCKNSIDFNKDYEGEGQPKKTETRPILLLHNIQTILNQNASIQEEKKYNIPDFIRFPFHLYKKEGWDVEHIRPNSLEDYEGERKKSARAKFVYVLRQSQDEKIKKIVDNYDKDVENNSANEETCFNALWEKLNDNSGNNELSEGNKNKIWNYVLLDSSTNREYGNSCFAIKREYVLKKEKGIKPKLYIDKQGVKSIDVKETAFVPVCTKNVFSKTYTAYPEDLKYWTEKDAFYYRLDMEKTLWWYCWGKDLLKEFYDEQERNDNFKKYEDYVIKNNNYSVTFKEWYTNDKGRQC